MVVIEVLNLKAEETTGRFCAVPSLALLFIARGEDHFERITFQLTNTIALFEEKRREILVGVTIFGGMFEITAQFTVRSGEILQFDWLLCS